MKTVHAKRCKVNILTTWWWQERLITIEGMQVTGLCSGSGAPVSKLWLLCMNQYTREDRWWLQARREGRRL